jgi:hypothetical protein
MSVLDSKEKVEELGKMRSTNRSRRYAAD